MPMSSPDPAESAGLEVEELDQLCEPGPERPVTDAVSGVDRLRPLGEEPVELVDGEAGAWVGAAEIHRPSYGPTRRRRRPGAPLYRRARGAGLTALAAPVAVMVYGLGAARAIGDRVAQRRGGTAGQPFRRPSDMPDAGLSVPDVVAKLEAFPFRPSRRSARRSFYSSFGVETLALMVSHQPALLGLPHIYPQHFRPVLLEGWEGERIAGLQAMHHTPGPALVVAHGLLNSKHFDYVRQIATKAFYEWGFHVVTLDMRGWGQTAWTSEAPSASGWAEGRDIAEIAARLKRDERVTSVGAIGYSLGGCAVLNAAHAASHDVAASADGSCSLDGGVLALSAPTHVAKAIDHISTRPSIRDPFLPLYYVFHHSLRTGMRARGYGNGYRDWRDVTSRLAAPWYGVEAEEFSARASAVNWAHEIEVPTLHVHAEDDFVVPPEHADLLAQAADGNEQVHVWKVARGNHCGFAAEDERWFHSVVRRWFEYWAREAPNRAGAARD